MRAVKALVNLCRCSSELLKVANAIGTKTQINITNLSTAFFLASYSSNLSIITYIYTYFSKDSASKGGQFSHFEFINFIFKFFWFQNINTRQLQI